MKWLLDANVLIALGWPAHEHHETARRWFNLDTAVGRARVGRDGARWQGATTLRAEPGHKQSVRTVCAWQRPEPLALADAREKEQGRQRAPARLNRVRRAVTQEVWAIGRANACTRAVLSSTDKRSTAVSRFKRHAAEGWASTALTQAAFVRIVSQPAFSGRVISVAQATELLLRNTAHTKHRLLPLDLGFEQLMGCCSGGLFSHRQITDAYLLTTAARHGARLLTFDSGIGQLLATPEERERLLCVLH